TLCTASTKYCSNLLQPKYSQLFLCSSYSSKAPSRAYRRRVRKRWLALNKPTLDEAQFQKCISELPPRFTPEELYNILTLQEDPLVCLELFNWASQQPRFRHNVDTYHMVIKKLGAAKMYQEMDDVVNQVLAIPNMGSEALYNTMIYYFTENRKLSRAVNIFRHMKKSRNLDCRPSTRTYNLLFAAFLSRGSNSYVSHVYMDTIRCLFKQMVNDGIEPDTFTLNFMIKGYVLSLHVNDGLRIFHQMGVVYNCQPNSYSYDYLIHGLCAQSRTNNARELCEEMKRKGLIPSSKSYNSVINSLALNGETDEAVNFLWEMIDKHRPVDFITYRTLLDEICRQGRVQQALHLLNKLQEKRIVDEITYRKLSIVLEDDFDHSIDKRTEDAFTQHDVAIAEFMYNASSPGGILTESWRTSTFASDLAFLGLIDIHILELKFNSHEFQQLNGQYPDPVNSPIWLLGYGDHKP
ncbi:Pentatricopeptide repeat, partial [Dillenia turbinata]